MISFKEILGSHLVSDVPLDRQHNIEDLLISVNKLREEWGKPLIVTSGYRSMQEHLVIYSKKGIFPPNVPLKSRHLFGLAVDLADPDGSLYKWASENEAKLKAWNIWCEKDTKGWLHCQCVPYGSYINGKSMFFTP